MKYCNVLTDKSWVSTGNGANAKTVVTTPREAFLAEFSLD
jgi:hypothetical protein